MACVTSQLLLSQGGATIGETTVCCFYFLENTRCEARESLQKGRDDIAVYAMELISSYTKVFYGFYSLNNLTLNSET